MKQSLTVVLAMVLLAVSSCQYKAVQQTQEPLSSPADVNNQTSSCGHTNIDHIVQNNKQFDSDDYITEFEITKRYLNFPVKDGGKKRLMKLIIDGKSVREFEIEIADGPADYWVFLDVREFEGKDVVLQAPRYREDNTEILQQVTQDDKIMGNASLYKEKLRGQFHFSSKRGWNNDSNGMVYYKGLYHLFYQHNPYGWSWGNMTWGHAVSKDMVHWTELSDAIHPDELGTIFSGSAVVDKNNTAGFKTGDESPIVCFYTSAGGTNPWSKGAKFTQSIAYSNDGGMTWTKYQGNPVIKHIIGANRDPKVFWHKPTNKWVMVLFLDAGELAIFNSDNLKEWTETSRIKPFHECPELFELPVDGNSNNTRWVLYGANGDYLIGSFDGKKYQPQTELIKFEHGNTFYASQTFNNAPDKRRVQIAWGRVDTPGMPFNQCMLFPVSLTLHNTADGLLMFANPIDEIKSLYAKEKSWNNETIEPGDNLLAGYAGDLFDIETVLDVRGAETAGFNIRGVKIEYNVKDQRLNCDGHSANLIPQDGKIQLRILVDINTTEIFAAEGKVYMPMKSVNANRQDRSIGIFTTGGRTQLISLHVRELVSAWLY